MNIKIQNAVFYSFLIVFAIAYFLLINYWKVTQVSDFLNYYQEALKWKNTGVMDKNFLFFQAPGHPILLSLWMKLFNSTFLIQIQGISKMFHQIPPHIFVPSAPL